VDGDEDVRSDFSCPYCYEDFDLTSLCSHLEDEHCFEFKPAVSYSHSSIVFFISLWIALYIPGFSWSGTLHYEVL